MMRATAGVVLGLALLSGCHSRKALDNCNQAYRALARSTYEAAPATGVDPACPPAITNAVLEQHLDELELSYEPIVREGHSFYLIPFSDESGDYNIVVAATPGDRLDIVMPRLGTIDLAHDPTSRQLADLMVLSHLMNLNYQDSFVKYAWDDSDGEVRATIQLRLEDGLTSDTLGIYLHHLVSTVVKEDGVPGLLSGLDDLSEEDLQELIEDAGDIQPPDGFDF